VERGGVWACRYAESAATPATTTNAAVERDIYWGARLPGPAVRL